MLKNIKNTLIIGLLFAASIAQCSKFGEKIREINSFISESTWNLIKLTKDVPGGKLVVSVSLAVGGLALVVKGAQITYKNGKELYNELVKLVKQKTINVKNVAQNFGKGLLGIILINVASPVYGTARGQILRSL